MTWTVYLFLICSGSNVLCDIDLEDQIADEDIEVDKLSALIHRLSDDLEASLTSEVQRDLVLYNTKQRILTVEAGACEDPFLEFLCTASGACLKYYQVCDGYSDCPDGQDETDCDLSVYIEEGTVLTGELVYDHCSLMALTTYRYEITTIERDPVFPNILTIPIHVTSTGIHDDGETGYLDLITDAKWIFASRSLYFEGTGGNAIDYFDVFLPENHTAMTSYAVRQNTREICGIYRMWKEK